MDAANFKVGSYYESLVLLNSPMLETLIKIYNRQPTEDKHTGTTQSARRSYRSLRNTSDDKVVPHRQEYRYLQQGAGQKQASCAWKWLSSSPLQIFQNG